MIDERELTDLMGQLANTYELPENGPGAILKAAGEDMAKPRAVVGQVGFRQRANRLLPAAAAVAVFVMAAAVVGTLGNDQVDTATSTAQLRTAEKAGGPASGVTAGGPSPNAATDSVPPLAFQGGEPAQTQSQAQPQLQPHQLSTAAGAAPATPAGAGGAGPDAGARVVKTGEVQLEVARGRFGGAIERLTALALSRGGFVAQSETTEGDSAPSGTITLRVPVGAFDTVVEEIRRLGKVVSAASRGQDVTAQYSDVEARLRGLNASRDQILTVLSKANTVGDILAVQERLNAVQVQIEQLQGQQKLLDDQTNFATVAVRLAEPGGPGLGASTERSGLSGAWDKARRGFGDGLEAIVAGSGTVLIVGLALVVLALAGRASWVLVRRRLV